MSVFFFLFLYRDLEWEKRPVSFLFVQEFSVSVVHRYVEPFSRGSQARVRWRIKMPVHQNPFSARVSKYWRSWIEICIDSEIGKIFPLVKENVCLRWRWSCQKWDKSQEKRHKRERTRKGSSHGIRPDEGPYCSLKFNMTCAIRSIRTRLPATHPGQSNSTANIMRLLDVSLREHTCQVFSPSFCSAK